MNKLGLVVSVTILVGLFVVFVMLGDNQKNVSNRACEPIIWAGNLVLSVTDFYDVHQANLLARKTFQPALSSCVNSAYELFYGEKVLEHLKRIPDSLFK